MASTPTNNLGDCWRNIRCFAAVVRSPAAVRNAFEGHPGLAWLAFGVGSYFIEVAALVTREPARRQRWPGQASSPKQGLN